MSNKIATRSLLILIYFEKFQTFPFVILRNRDLRQILKIGIVISVSALFITSIVL